MVKNLRCLNIYFLNFYSPLPATPGHLAPVPSAPVPPISAPGLLAGITPLTPRPDPSAAARIRRNLYDGDGGKEAGSGGSKEVENGRSGDQGLGLGAKETSAAIGSEVEVLLAASCSSLQAVAGFSPGRVSFWARWGVQSVSVYIYPFYHEGGINPYWKRRKI